LKKVYSCGEMLRIKTLPGMEDILPEQMVKWQAIERKAREVFLVYGYSEIRTPLLEDAMLFSQSVGEETDIVKKQMFSFLIGKDKRVCLRPEGTAPVVRAYLQHSVFRRQGLVKYYYLGAMFRYERPQKGRKRQFYQIGAEAIGSNSPYLDAEIIYLVNNLLQAVAIDGYQIRLNSIGCLDCQANYKHLLRDYLRDKKDLLCPDCQCRAETNLLRILDCKNKQCREIIRSFPPILDYLCAKCKEHFAKVKRILTEIGINYVIDAHIVRGLDYYTNTVFEFIHPELGSQNALAGGGRYNNLIEQMGGEKQPAVGFSLGMERMMAISRLEPQVLPLHIFFALMGERAYDWGYKMLAHLRSKGISSEIDYQNRSLKSQLRKANRLKAKFVVIAGEKELNKGKIILRDMRKQEQREINLEKAEAELCALIPADS